MHPQKRQLLKQLLDSLIGRFLEIKKEMVNLELSEYHFLDKMLINFKLTPNDVEIPIPKYFVIDNYKILKDRECFMDKIMSNNKSTTEEVSVCKICLAIFN